MSTSAESLVEHVESLIPLPEIYLKVKQMIDDGNSSLSDIGAVIGNDPALTARLLKIANSPFFGVASKIETVSRAINLIGMDQLHDLLLATAVTAATARLPDSALDMARFWRRSVSCGTAARLIAYRCNALDGERLFVAGLLHDIGTLVIAQFLPDQHAEIERRTSGSTQPRHRIEKEVLGFDHTAVGGELLRAWSLPEMLREAVGCHVDPAGAQKYLFEAAVVHAAAVIGEASESDEEPGSSIRSMQPQAVGMLNLGPDAVAEIAAETELSLDQTMQLFMPGTREAYRHARKG